MTQYILIIHRFLSSHKLIRLNLIIYAKYWQAGTYRGANVFIKEARRNLPLSPYENVAKGTKPLPDTETSLFSDFQALGKVRNVSIFQFTLHSKSTDVNMI